MLRLKRVVEGLTTVTIGLMIIGNSVGLLSWRVWVTVLSLWPLLLVAIGLDLIGKGAKLNIVRVLSSLLVLGGLVYAASTAPGSGPLWTLRWSDSEPFEVAAERSRRIDEASARISLPAASIEIGEGSELFSATGRMPYAKPELAEERSGDRAELVLDSEGEGPVFLFADNAYATIGLDPEVEWELFVEAGAAEADVDLEGFRVAGVSVETGVAMVDLTLGEPVDGDVPVNISAGISDVKVRLPEGVEARVESSHGLGGIDTPSGWERAQGERVWESPGFSDARARYVIVVEAGIGSVDVVRY